MYFSVSGWLGFLVCAVFVALPLLMQRFREGKCFPCHLTFLLSIKTWLYYKIYSTIHMIALKQGNLCLLILSSCFCVSKDYDAGGPLLNYHQVVRGILSITYKFGSLLFFFWRSMGGKCLFFFLFNVLFSCLQSWIGF